MANVKTIIVKLYNWQCQMRVICFPFIPVYAMFPKVLSLVVETYNSSVPLFHFVPWTIIFTPTAYIFEILSTRSRFNNSTYTIRLTRYQPLCSQYWFHFWWTSWSAKYICWIQILLFANSWTVLCLSLHWSLSNWYQYHDRYRDQSTLSLTTAHSVTIYEILK